MSRITINSNISSLNAQRNFSDVTKKLGTSFTRLSSGLRINKASDDAAGLSISSLLSADKRIFNQGVRNINDGISYLNVAESAIGELTNVITRIQELAEQGANGTLGSAQRNALQQEVNSLQSEYNRIIQSTSFNGNKLLTGNTTKTVLQGGYGVNGQLTTQIGVAEIEGALNNLAGETTKVSITASGTEGNLSSANNGAYISVSGDGRYVAFRSSASNLIAGDANGTQDVFVKDTLLGTITGVSVTSSGATGNLNSAGPSISSDGNFVSFHSTSSNLVAGDTNSANDVFLRNLAQGTTELVSVSTAGVQGNAASLRSSVSADGQFVAFGSVATNLVNNDTNGVEDVFIRDTKNRTTTLISVATDGTQGNAQSTITKAGSISADGRYVVFQSNATNLVAGDTNGVEDIFVRDTVLGTTTLVSQSTSGAQSNGGSSAASISADGRYVVFASSATNLVAGDTNGATDIFMRDLLTGTTTRVSTDANGSQGNADSTQASITADGKFVSFTSVATNLVSGDTNGVADIFVKNTETGEITRASVNRLGMEQNGAAFNSSLSADGRTIAFDSDASNLVTGDTNGVGDVFLRDLSKAGVNEIAGFVVSNQASAKVSLDLARKYQEELSRYRGAIGASLSRATTFVATLQTSALNYESAASQIVDADVAEESSKLTSNKILQQAAASVLSQANLQPSLVLSLLKGI